MRDVLRSGVVVLAAALLLIACGGEGEPQVTQTPQESSDVDQVDVVGAPVTPAAAMFSSPMPGDQPAGDGGEVAQETPWRAAPSTAAQAAEVPSATPAEVDGPLASEDDPALAQVGLEDPMPYADALAKQAAPMDGSSASGSPASGDGALDAGIAEGQLAVEAEGGLTDEQRWLLESLPSLGPAPELENEVWLNSEPLRLADLQGQVVLLDMWTFG